MHQVKETFNAIASTYDEQRKWIIPELSMLYGAAVWAAALTGKRPAILDIGAGTGLLSELLLEAYPGASVTLMDISEQMIEVARRRFAGREGFRFVAADYRHEDLGGPFDAICSALSIHHLEKEEKRDLYQKIFGALKPGGIFVNADQVKGETPLLHRRNLSYWDEYVLHGPLDPNEIQAMFERRKNRSFAVFTGRVSR